MKVIDKHAYEDVVVGPDNLEVVHCQTCGFAHQNPIPDPAELTNLYTSHFWEDHKPEALDRFLEQQEWWDMTYRDWLVLAGAYPYPLKSRLLDVGCGYGFFAKTATAEGWKVDAIDASSKAVEYARKLVPEANIRQAEWGGWPLEDRYGMVTAFWLIEHLSDPEAFLQRTRRWLIDDGLLLLVTPNEWSALQSEANAKAAIKNWWIHPTHINYFSWETATDLLERNGFRILDRMTSYPMENFILDGADYTANSEFGRKHHDNVEAFELRTERAVRMDSYRSMAARSQGRDMVIVARKMDD